MHKLWRLLGYAPAAWLTLVLMWIGFFGYVTGRLHGTWLLAWAGLMLLAIAFGPTVDEIIGRGDDGR